MITVRLLVLTSSFTLVERDVNLESDVGVTLQLTYVCQLLMYGDALLGVRTAVKRIELPQHIFPDGQRFLIPWKDGVVSLESIV